MFDKFGEFGSSEELNLAAEGQKDQGDLKSLIALAKENGIEEEMAIAYFNGEIPYMTDSMSLAIGKLSIEKITIKTPMPLEPIVHYLSSLCVNEILARIICSKDKKLKECIDKVTEKSKEEYKKMNINKGETFYIADMTVFKWAKDYYTKG